MLRRNYTVFFTFVLLFCVNVKVIAQSIDDGSVKTDLPVSFNIPLYFINDSNDDVHLGTGLSSSLRVSKSFNIGCCFRLWGNKSRYGPITAYPHDGFYRTRSYSYSILANVEWYPISNHSFFIRLGSGVSLLPELRQTGDVEVHCDSWPFSLLTGFGVNIPIANHMFVSPQYEFIKFFRNETDRSTKSAWLFQMGVSLTIR